MRLRELRAYLAAFDRAHSGADALEVRVFEGERELEIHDLVFRATKPHALYLDASETLDPATGEEPF